LTVVWQKKRKDPLEVPRFPPCSQQKPGRRPWNLREGFFRVFCRIVSQDCCHVRRTESSRLQPWSPRSTARTKTSKSEHADTTLRSPSENGDNVPARCELPSRAEPRLSMQREKGKGATLCWLHHKEEGRRHLERIPAGGGGRRFSYYVLADRKEKGWSRPGAIVMDYLERSPPPVLSTITAK